MAGTLFPESGAIEMKILLIKPYRTLPSGAILDDVAKPVADLLIERKIARLYRKKKAKKNDN